MNHATATYEIVSWDEETFDDIADGPRFSRARVVKTFAGDLRGEGQVTYLMAHRRDGTATFVGYERVTGVLGDRAGSFVLEHTGTYEGRMARTRWKVVSGSATGELRGLRGRGGSAAGDAGRRYPMTLEYDIV